MTTNFDLNKAWSETTAGTDSGATATHAAESNVAHVVTHVSGHGDADATIQLRVRLFRQVLLIVRLIFAGLVFHRKGNYCGVYFDAGTT